MDVFLPLFFSFALCILFFIFARFYSTDMQMMRIHFPLFFFSFMSFLFFLLSRSHSLAWRLWIQGGFAPVKLLERSNRRWKFFQIHGDICLNFKWKKLTQTPTWRFPIAPITLTGLSSLLPLWPPLLRSPFISQWHAGSYPLSRGGKRDVT